MTRLEVLGLSLGLGLGLSLGLVATAHADGILVQGDYPKINVEVGKTIQASVGHFRGYWGCDDTTLISGDIITKDDTNYFVVTGVKAGSTQCRVGLVATGGFTVFDVYVTAAAKAAPKK